MCGLRRCPSFFSWVLIKRFHCTHTIHTHTHAHTYKYLYTHTIHIHVHIFTYTHIHTYMHKQHMHRRMHVNAHAHLHTTVLIPMSQINSMHQLGYVYSQIWLTENKFYYLFQIVIYPWSSLTYPIIFLSLKAEIFIALYHRRRKMFYSEGAKLVFSWVRYITGQGLI